jgi:ATP-binding cassette subfamily C protein LapB
MKTDSLLQNREDGWAADTCPTPDDCLLDCLLELSRIHGVPTTSRALSAGLPLVQGLLTPALLPRAAARAGLSARMARCTLRRIPAGVLPAILLLHGKRACLLLEIRPDGKCLISNPDLSADAIEVDGRTLAQDYTGVAYYVRPRFRFDVRTADMDSQPGRHWFWAAVAANRGLYRDAALSALLINVFAMALPLFTMNVYDRVLPNHAVDTLWAMAVGIGIVLAFNAMLTVARAHVIDSAGKRIDVSLSSSIMERVLDLRMHGRPRSVGAFAANVRSFEAIRDFIASGSIATLVDLPFILLFLMVLTWISPWMALPCLAAIVLTLLVSLLAQSRMAALMPASLRAASQRNASLVEALAGFETVKLLNAQGEVQRVWEQSTRYAAHLNGRLKMISNTAVATVATLQQLVTVSVMILGVYLARDSAISMGGIIAASMISGRCLAPLGQIAGLLMQYQNARASLGSIDKYMQLPVERPDATRFVRRPVVQGAIEFRNVSFTYPGAAQPVLKNLSFTVAPGEKIAILGRIGSGKSTLSRLLVGLYQPTDGIVMLDGVDVRQLDPADLRRAIGCVPQDPILFFGTLKQNIAMGSPQADDAAILGAARLAGVCDFTDVTPDGLDMVVTERGESLSGGQRQAVCIARALINDPPVLMLDEPTSNMDIQSEQRLKRRLAEAAADKTVLLATHRAALLDLVSRIIVIDNGRIVADGPKDRVMRALRAGSGASKAHAAQSPAAESHVLEPHGSESHVSESHTSEPHTSGPLGSEPSASEAHASVSNVSEPVA